MAKSLLPNTPAGLASSFARKTQAFQEAMRASEAS